MTAPLDLEIIGEVPGEIDLTALRAVVAAANDRASELGLPGGSINLTFCDDEEIRRYNREYSGNDYATDVLSFSYIESGEAIEGVIGEIIISLETAGRQAVAADSDITTEVATLALHGLLHIVGFDHAETADQDRMQHLQRELVEAAGLTYRDFKWHD